MISELYYNNKNNTILNFNNMNKLYENNVQLVIQHSVKL